MNQTEEVVAGPLTKLQSLEYEQMLATALNVRLGHAITFVNNHFPQFGSKSYTGDAYKADDKTTQMTEVPADLRKDLLLAGKAALGFITRSFNTEGQNAAADKE